MQKKQLFTRIAGGVMSLFVLGSITCCEGMFKGNTGAVVNGWEKKYQGHVIGDVYCNNNICVAFSDDIMLFSMDRGETWSEKQNWVKGMSCISFHENEWVAAGHNGCVYISMDNGETWNKKTTSTNYVRGIDFNNNVIMFFNAGYSVYVSTDKGNVFTQKFNNKDFQITKIVNNDSTWIITAKNGIWVSTNNGETWVNKQTGSFNDITYHNNMWIAVGDSGIIFVSTDGNTWVKKASNTSKKLSSIACNDTICIAIGYKGSIHISMDNGETWREKVENSLNVYSINSIAHNGNTWIAVGQTGRIQSVIYTSSDTAVWK